MKTAKALGIDNKWGKTKACEKRTCIEKYWLSWDLDSRETKWLMIRSHESQSEILPQKKGEGHEGTSCQVQLYRDHISRWKKWTTSN